MKHFKKIALTLLIMLAISYTSCDESIIDLEPIGLNSEQGFFQNEDQMKTAVLGIYQKLTFFYMMCPEMGVGYRCVSPSAVWLLPCDDLTTPGDIAFEKFVNLNEDDTRTWMFFMFAYQLINRANTVLQKIEENGDFAYTKNPELKNYNIGEALFLRAWMYYMLWNIYGTAAPLVQERIVNLEDAYPPSTTGTQLLDQAIIDLQEACSLLPSSWDDANRGRVFKSSAYGLLGKVLVYRGLVNNQPGDYTAAISAFNSITDRDLFTNQRYNFDATHENGVESLFEFQSTNNVNANHWLHNDRFDNVGTISAWYGWATGKVTSYVGNNYFIATQSLMNAYESGDPRIQYTFNPAGNPYNVLKYLKDGVLISKWGSTGDNLVNNPRILRYADILLLKAEAIVRSGGSLSEAIGLVNQIRQRARMSTEDGTEAAVPADRNISESDAGVVLEWIFQERRLELAFEQGNRWFDLRRRHMAGELSLLNLDFSSVKPDFTFTENNLNFPLPARELMQNPNLVQNAGY